MILCSIYESNDCHTPAGSSDGGQFCAQGSSATAAPFADLIAKATAFRDRGRTLGAVIVEYDQQRKTRRDYNPDALPQMLGVMQEAQLEIQQGMPVRQALIKNFVGSLLERLLHAVGEPATTQQERQQYSKLKGKK